MNKHVLKSSADLAASGAAAALYVGDLDSAAVGVAGTWVGSVTIQESPDGSAWFAVGANLNANGYRELDPNSQYCRTNFIARTSGTVESVVAGEQRSSDPGRLFYKAMADISAVTSGAGIDVSRLEDSKVWTEVPAGSCVYTPQYSADGSAWVTMSAALSTAGSFDVPDHTLQVRLLATVLATGSTMSGHVTGKNIRGGDYQTLDLGSYSTATSTSPLDVTRFRNGKLFFTNIDTTTVAMGSPDGTTFYEVTSVITADAVKSVPSWVRQLKIKSLSGPAAVVNGTLVESTGLRTDRANIG